MKIGKGYVMDSEVVGVINFSKNKFLQVATKEALGLEWKNFEFDSISEKEETYQKLLKVCEENDKRFNKQLNKY